MKKNDESLFLAYAKRWLELQPAVAFCFLVSLFCDSLIAVFSFTCLHPDDPLRKKNMLREVSDDDIPFRVGLYFTEYSDDDDSNREDNGLGIGDFFIYNLMLLWILPPLSTVSTKVGIAVGHIIAVQIGLDASDRLARLYKQTLYPAFPLPVVAVSIYAFLLDWANK
jgi:hypothetical protein